MYMTVIQCDKRFDLFFFVFVSFSVKRTKHEKNDTKITQKEKNQ